MRVLLFYIFLALLFFTGQPVPAAVPAAPAIPTARPAIFICGDSTAKFSDGETPANTPGRGKNGSPAAGWGTLIAAYFDPSRVTVKNVGHAGTSSLTYYTGDWPKILPQIKEGDFVLIVFGINDGGRATPNGTSDEVSQGPAGPQSHTYGWYLSKMATDARSKGAHAFFLTVTTRNIWTNPKLKFNDATPIGKIPGDYNPSKDRVERGTGNGRYTQWTKDVGKKLHIPVFDLTNYCADLYEKMGREDVNKLYSDHNHTYVSGAQIVAACVVAGLKAFNNSPFIPLFSEKAKNISVADAQYISDNLADAFIQPYRTTLPN